MDDCDRLEEEILKLTSQKTRLCVMFKGKTFRQMRNKRRS